MSVSARDDEQAHLRSIEASASAEYSVAAEETAAVDLQHKARLWEQEGREIDSAGNEPAPKNVPVPDSASSSELSLQRAHATAEEDKKEDPEDIPLPESVDSHSTEDKEGRQGERGEKTKPDSSATESFIDKTAKLFCSLQDAIQSNSEAAVASFLDIHPEYLEGQNARGNNPLHVAVDSANNGIVALLLERGANIEARDHSGQTTLHHAVTRGDIEIARALLERGADIEAISNDGARPLWRAARLGKECIARLLLEYDANSESSNAKTGTTALLEAVRRGDAAIVHVLLETGADVDASPSAAAAGNNRTEAMEASLLKSSLPHSGFETSAANRLSPKFSRPHEPSQHLRSGLTGSLNAQPMMSGVSTSRKKSKKSSSSSGALGWMARENRKSRRTAQRAETGWYSTPPTMDEHDHLDEVRRPIPNDALPRDLHHPPHPPPIIESVQEGFVPDIDRIREDFFEREEEANGTEESATSKVEAGKSLGREAMDQILREELAKEQEEAIQTEMARKLAEDEEETMIHEKASKTDKTMDPVRFKDCVGRKFTFPFQMVNSWQGMESLVRQAFLHVDVIEPYVQAGQYDLVGPEGDIMLPAVWSHIIKPGWSVTMQMWPMERPNPVELGDPRGVPVMAAGGPPGRPGDGHTHPEALPFPMDGRMAGLHGSRQGMHIPRPAPIGMGPPPRPLADLGTLKQTPLHEAVLHGDRGIVELLLRHGADPSLRNPSNLTAKDLAGRANQDIQGMLRSGLLVEGPILKKTKGKKKHKVPRPAHAFNLKAPHKSPAKMAACRTFQATMIEFYINGNERRSPPMSASVYELLFGKGPQAVCREYTQRPDESPTFTWYHIPANNMEWVDGLITRIIFERHAGHQTLEKELKEKLGILGSKTQQLGQSIRHTFMRPSCKEIKASFIGLPITHLLCPFPTDVYSKKGLDELWDPTRKISSLVAFIPYLHYETFEGHQLSQEAVSGPLAHPFQNLVQGYSHQNNPGEVPPLQLRRTLDQYFYSHVNKTPRRDADQVIYRYTRPTPKIFMVDQLWIWILDPRTIITCCPLNWGTWIVAPGQATETMIAPNDPLNILQKVLRYLKSPFREAVTSVHDMARLITDTCVGLFDQHGIQEEYQFFDFFERSIATVNDNATVLLQQFKESVDKTKLAAREDVVRHSSSSGTSPSLHEKGGDRADDSFDIRKEIDLLIEIQDILDELEILKMVLKDQGETVTQMKNILNKKDKEKSWDDNRVFAMHGYRIDRMKEIATKTHTSLIHLLDLKQKQANFKQARMSTKHAGATKEQLKLLNRQAEETDKQSKALLVFTVVTIVFLPSSFLAAVFAINLDAFPLNDEGRLPLSYFLKFLFTVSFATCFPLLVIAFNLDLISKILAWTRKSLLTLWGDLKSIIIKGVLVPIILLVITAAIFVAIWTTPLDKGVKVAVTACFMVMLLLTLLGYGLYSLVATARYRATSITTNSTTSSEILDY